MALRLNPLPTQTFALPQMASLRSPKFRMASTLRSGAKSVLPLSDLLLFTQIMHFPFFSLPSFFTLLFFFSAFSITVMPQTKPNYFENHALCYLSVLMLCLLFSFFQFVFKFTFFFLHQLFSAEDAIPHVSFPNLMGGVVRFYVFI